MEKSRKVSGLSMRDIFRCMMENSYNPTFEPTHIQFELDNDIAVLEYEEGVLSVRLFFSIDEEAYELFLEASNMMMIETFAVKPVILEDMKNIMFSCETRCDTLREFKKCLPWAIDKIKEGLRVHKGAMKKLIIASELVSKTIPATDDPAAGSRKILS